MPGKNPRLRLLVIFRASLALALSGYGASPALASPANKPGWHECDGVAGYAVFQARLRAVVAARDVVAFRALFHPAGAMRVHGIGGPASYADWGLDRPGASAVWAELDKILQLGCAKAGEKLLLPAVATRSDVPEGDLVVLRRTAVRTQPRGDAAIVRMAKPGQVLTPLENDTRDGWITVRASGRKAYVPASALRSPLDLRLELVRFEGEWRVKSFGDGV